MGKPALVEVEVDPSPEHSALVAAIERYRTATAELVEIRHSLSKTRESGYALSRHLDAADAALAETKATAQGRAFATVRQTGTLGEDRVLLDAEAAATKAAGDYTLSKTTRTMLEAVEREAAFKADAASYKLDEAATAVAMLSIPAIMERGLAHQVELHRARASLNAILSCLRTASPEIRGLAFELNANAVPESYSSSVAWAGYIQKLREDAHAAIPE